ncbi:hypothetical protein Hanom_Chr11g00980011 [Helianthus anomalus]
MLCFNAGVRVIRDPNWLRKRPILLMSIFLCSGYSPVVRLDSNPLKCLIKLYVSLIIFLVTQLILQSVGNTSSCFGTLLVSQKLKY